MQCPRKPITGEKTRPPSTQTKSALLAPRSRNPYEMEEDECEINHKFLGNINFVCVCSISSPMHIAVGMKYRHRRSDFSRLVSATVPSGL